MENYDFQILAEPAGIKLPRLHKIKRPRTNYFKEKDRAESIPLKASIKDDFKIPRGKSKDYFRIYNNPITQQEGIILKDPTNTQTMPNTKAMSEWSKRIYFNKRGEMSSKNLLIIIFDGVIGDCFKKNLWEEGPVKLYFRRGVIKELKRLKEDFQLALFFVSEDIKARKILKYFTTKDIFFDAVYKSRNHSRFMKKTMKNISKKPLKYSEFIQDYTQVYADFGLQNRVSEKVLIVTSIALSPEDMERKGEDLLCYSVSKNLITFLW